MKNCFLAVLAIVSTVIGSGFISGKEIVVFFSRFGNFSFLGIALAGILFFALIFLLLQHSDRVLQRVNKSKFVFFINMLICIVFTAAMFAAAINLLNWDKSILSISAFCAILCICALVCRNGLSSLDKINFALVPSMLFCLVVCLCSRAKPSAGFPQGVAGGAAGLYGALYVVLNIASSSVLIAGLGHKLNRRQKTQVAIIAALVLSVILLFANTVLLQNPQAFDKDMPLLSLFTSWQHQLMSIVVFFGCTSTLFSLVCTSSVTMRGLCSSEIGIFAICVLLPLILSLLGFSFIVAYLYPLCSILGVFLLFFMLLPERSNAVSKWRDFLRRKKS